MKIVIVVLGLAVSLLTGGCGNNESTNVETMTTKEVKEVAKEVADKSDDSVSQVVETEKEVDTDVTDSEEVNIELADTEESEDAEVSAEIEELPPITDYALSQDKSAEYGVNSTSSYDVAQFLDDLGRTEWYGDTESEEYNFYTGRFAYPEVSACSLFDNISLSYRTDDGEVLQVTNTETGELNTIMIDAGTFSYSMFKEVVGVGAEDNKPE